MTKAQLATGTSLKISQVLLEEAHMGHIPDYFARDPKTEIKELPTGLAIEVQRDTANNRKAIVRLRATCDDPTALYSFRVSYVALLTWAAEDEEDEFERRLAVTGATILMPFVREAVANLTGRGRFGPVWTSPVNFGKLAAEAASKQKTVSKER